MSARCWTCGAWVVLSRCPRCGDDRQMTEAELERLKAKAPIPPGLYRPEKRDI